MSLAADHISVSRGAQTLIGDVTCSLFAGDFLGICGPNGAGKSTLLRCLAGLEKPQRGKVSLHGRTLDDYSLHQRAIHIGYLPQHPTLAWPMTVTEIVGLGRVPYLTRWRQRDREGATHVAEAMQETGLKELADRKSSTLSGGEQRRVHVARLLAGQHPILLADEPTASLDPRYQLEILTLLKAVAARGVAVAIVLHDLPLAARYCSRVLVLNRGQVIAAGNASEALSDEVVRATFGVRALRDPISRDLIALASLDPTNSGI